VSTPQYSHILKLQRATKHLLDLHTASEEWFQEGHHRQSWFEVDANEPEYVLLKASADPIPPQPFSLLASDAIHNMRSALDSLVFALAVAKYRPNGVPDKIARDCQFPIIGDEDRNGKSGCGPQMFKSQSFRIAGLHPQAQAVIEDIQPYTLGSNFRDHQLWQLAELSNTDKHRLLHAGAAAFTRTFYPAKEFQANGSLTLENATIERETIMARLHKADFPEGNPQMNAEVGLTMQVAFADGPYAAESMYGILSLIATYITTHVLPQLEPFL
jgi:hypothetical protein